MHGGGAGPLEGLGAFSDGVAGGINVVQEEQAFPGESGRGMHGKGASYILQSLFGRKRYLRLSPADAAQVVDGERYLPLFGEELAEEQRLIEAPFPQLSRV